MLILSPRSSRQKALSSDMNTRTHNFSSYLIYIRDERNQQRSLVPRNCVPRLRDHDRGSEDHLVGRRNPFSVRFRIMGSARLVGLGTSKGGKGLC
jgi:hypothetical protein